MFAHKHPHYRHLKLGETNSITSVVVGGCPHFFVFLCYQVM